MNASINLNKRWIAALHGSIDKLDEGLKLSIMNSAGVKCAADLLLLCEKYLGKQINTVDDLISGWNILRDKRNLKGRWEYASDMIRGIFGECGCPLIRSGLIGLHPVQCYCSQGMMETIFSQVAKNPVKVEIRQSIGRGDTVCEFLIKL